MSGPERERGSPFLVPIEPGGDGRAWLGCLEWEAGAGDRIVVRELQPDCRVARELPVQDAPAEIVRPVGVLDRLGRLCVVWTEPVDGVAQLRLARLERTRDAEGREREGFTPARSLTSGRDPNRNVEAVRHSDGRVWLAWESHRGSIDVVVAPLSDDGCLGEAQVLGDGRFSDVDPVIASRGSKLEVAWSQYQGRDYEIVLRAFDPARGERGETLNVTQDGSSDDLHPALAVAPGGDLWLAWDRLVDSTRGSSMPETQRPAAREQHDVFVMTARVRGDHVELPAAREGWPAGAVAGAPRFSWMGGVPRLAIGGDGRPWIAYRYLLPFALGNGRKYYGEPVLVHRFGDDGWSLATEIGDSLGFAEEPALAASSSGVLCAGQQDRRERAATLYDGELAPAPLREALAKQGVDVNSWFGPTGIFVTRLDRAAAGDPDPVAFVERPDRRAPQHFHPSGDALDDPIVSGASHLEVTRKSQRFTVYWGDLHRHSSICLLYTSDAADE